MGVNPNVIPQSDVRVGIDLGGTKIEILVLERSGQERMRRRVPTPQGDYAATVRAIAELVQGSDTGDAPVGVGIPGTISPATGLVKNANSTCLIGHPLDRDLASAMNRKVRLANDADCFVLSESVDGAGVDAGSVFGIIIGTGVGGGLVVGKRVVQGPNAIAGEWGHNPLPWPEDTERPGDACYCGLRGCIETFLSGPAVSLEYAAMVEAQLNATEIEQHAANGEKVAQTLMQKYMDRFARATAGVINIFDPEIIVVGGGLSKLKGLYEDVPALWPKYVFSDTVATRIAPAKYGPESGARGAAWLWP